jgi:hypothetical protein
MSDNRSISIGRDAVGVVATTGDNNRIDAKIDARLSKVTLPPAESVNISAELAQIKAILEKLGGEHAPKIGRALDDASDEAGKPKPDQDEVGSALARALEYATKNTAFADEAKALAPHITNAVGWLGSNWHKLLPLVGLAL